MSSAVLSYLSDSDVYPHFIFKRTDKNEAESNNCSWQFLILYSFSLYFLKIKYTARIRKQNPIAWFSLKDSFLKTNIVKSEKTIKVITSCITFNCHKLNGPPFSLKPILFAGTWKEYSNKAIPQLISIIIGKVKLLNQLISLNLRCPYHAIVINMLDSISKPMV